jgi:hypothetical protein
LLLVPSDVEELLSIIETSAARGRRCGAAIALENRGRLAELPPLAARYTVLTLYALQGDQVMASPAVAFWMRFNGNVHVFDHRYDGNSLPLAVEAVTREQILNHILGSFDFFKMHAFARESFPGYR